MKKLFLFVLVSGLLLSCAMQQRMIHPDNRVIDCKTYYYGVIGVIMAAEIITDCITRHQSLGFVEAKQDASGSWIPKNKEEEVRYQNLKELIRLKQVAKE
jgi:hypothetical protein